MCFHEAIYQRFQTLPNGRVSDCGTIFGECDCPGRGGKRGAKCLLSMKACYFNWTEKRVARIIPTCDLWIAEAFYTRFGRGRTCPFFSVFSREFSVPSIIRSISTLRTTLALRSPGSMVVDLLVVAAIVSLVGGLIAYGQQFGAAFTQKTNISLAWTALPVYTFFSLCRGFAAYAVSLVFTLLFATAAARSERTERIMLPILDVLQSIPVLGFLPALVLGMIALFPTREIGLEIACIIMIFTGQAWNMTFSYYASLKGIPAPLREAARMNGLSRWRTFRVLELPASMIGLVWNSMMSMAGGWFFLTVNEAFTLGDKDFRIPGIGSYMAEAINAGNTSAMIAAVVGDDGHDRGGGSALLAADHGLEPAALRWKKPRRPISRSRGF